MIIAPRKSLVVRAPLKCGECGERRVVAVKERYEVTIDHDGRSYPLSIPKLELLKCEVCGNRILPDAAGERVNEALRHAAGLLSPGELKKHRLKLGLTQKELAERLRIAEATLSRWETGAQIQQRGYDVLLRLVFELSAVRDHLHFRANTSLRWSDIRSKEATIKSTARSGITDRVFGRQLDELAICLSGAADEIGLADELRTVVLRAAKHACKINPLLDVEPEDLENVHSSWGHYALLVRIAYALDADVRERRKDEQGVRMPKGSKKDKKPKKKGRR